jgi:O-antigen ligase
MTEAYRHSLLGRFLAALAVVYHGSVLHRFFAAIGRVWRESATCRYLVRRLSAPMASTQQSILGRLSNRLNAFLARLRLLPEMWHSSLLCAIYNTLMRWGRSSRILGWLFRGGLTAILLLVLALYEPVDYVLRDVLSVPILSSLWDEALLLFSVFWILRTRATEGQPLENRANTMDTPLILFLGVGLMLMFLVSPFFSIAVEGYRATVQYMLWFFVVTRLLRDDRDFHLMYRAMVLFAAVIALHGIYQYIIAAPIPSSWVDQAETSVRTRVYSIFGSPNIMGDFMVMFAPMAAGLAYYCKDRKQKVFYWACTLAMCLACLFTMSRGAWVAMAVAVLIFAFLHDRKLFLLMLAAGFVAMFIPFVASRIGYLFTDDFAASTSNGGRGSRWAIGLGYLSESPILGLGLGMFGGAVAMQHKVYSWMSYFYIDNYYLKILTEMGYLGFAFFVLLLVCLVLFCCRAVWRTKQPSGEGTSPMCVGMFAGLCGVLVHCYFENIFEEPYMMAYFWIIAALIAYLGFFRKPSAGNTAD